LIGKLELRFIFYRVKMQELQRLN